MELRPGIQPATTGEFPTPELVLLTQKHTPMFIQGHSNWQGQPPIGGRSEGEWQAMQQAPPTSQGALQGQMFPGQGQFVNMATPQGYAAGGGYGGGQGSGGVSGQPAGPYGYPQQHVPHQQTQQWHQQVWCVCVCA